MTPSMSQHVSFNDLLDSPLRDFESQMSEFLANLGIDLGDLEIDHLGLRFGDEQQINKLADELRGLGEVVSQNEIHDRVIYVFKLNQPIKFLGKQVSYIELPYPKVGRDYNGGKQGWEHFEVHLPGENNKVLHEMDEDEALKAYLAQFNQLFLDLDLSAVHNRKIIADSRKAKGETWPNLLLTLELDEVDFRAIRFHPRTIAQVVNNELGD